MLCDECENKPAALAVPGTCNMCSGLTSAFAYQLCADCSFDHDLCERCGCTLEDEDEDNVVQTTNAYVTTVRPTDNGKTFGSLRPGEEIHIILAEDQYSNAEWDVIKPVHSCFRLKTAGVFTPDPKNAQYGTRTFVFEVQHSGNGSISFCEVQRYRGWFGGTSGTSSVIPNGQIFQATFDVK